MKSSPIYNIIQNDSRKADCSFGSTRGFNQDIRVGTSASNSHTLAEITVERYTEDDGSVRFTMFVDGIPCKTGILSGKNFVNWYRFEFEQHSLQSREDDYQAERYA